jgi:transposase
MFTERLKKYSHTLREEGRLRVFENRVLREMLGGKSDWRTVHSEKPHDVISLPKSIAAIQSRKVKR